jgi:hypothetical protein
MDEPLFIKNLKSDVDFCFSIHGPYIGNHYYGAVWFGPLFKYGVSNSLISSKIMFLSLLRNRSGLYNFSDFVTPILIGEASNKHSHKKMKGPSYRL